MLSKDIQAFRPSPRQRTDGPASPIWATQSKGRAGLYTLIAVLIALEADSFVLTTTSNLSRLIDELRKNVVNPRCCWCTSMIDLRPRSDRKPFAID